MVVGKNVSSEAKYFADQTGVFEIAQDSKDKNNKVMRQVSCFSWGEAAMIVSFFSCTYHIICAYHAFAAVMPKR